MNTIPNSPQNPTPERPRPVVVANRSLGLKFIVILALVVLMAIPVMFISFVSFERSARANDVTREISQIYGGEQRLLGPLIVVPYQQTLSGRRLREGDYIVSAQSGVATLDDVSVEAKSRSLFKVPVYTAEARLQAILPNLADQLPATDGYRFDIDRALLVVGLADVTGLQSDVTLISGNRTVTFEPYRSTESFRSGPLLYSAELDVEMETQSDRPRVEVDRFDGAGLTLLSVPLSDAMADGGEVEARLTFTGATRLSMLPYARSTTFHVSSDWPHPGFYGRYPPSERSITEDGFSATWSVPFLRRGVNADGRTSDMMVLMRGSADMQVNFVSPLNPYQTVNRALKYAVLFIGLVFIAYFLMETLLGVRVHPAQYLLIGIAQAVFYLLLLAFAEQIGFTLAFLISALATVALTAGYAGAVFGRSLIWKSALVFGAVYGLLFVLMRIQDFALMVGALTCFVAIAATLYLTRNLDWYGGREG